VSDETTTLDALVPDPANRRDHPARNLQMITAALRDIGPARSIVIDEQNVVLAGNGVTAAAADAGITRVRIVEPAADELIAVRRRGLSDDEKRRLALYDNRTGELAEWNVERLRADGAAGLDFHPFFFADELESLVGVPTAEQWAESAGKLPQGERSGFQHVTFVLTDAQVATVRAAIVEAKARGDFGATGNENSNGNALDRICDGVCRQSKTWSCGRLIGRRRTPACAACTTAGAPCRIRSSISACSGRARLKGRSNSGRRSTSGD
jgi:hypothetical protein